MFDIPVALIFFNRPEKLSQVFNVVKKMKPQKLFLIQDGPRDDNYEDDKAKIMECREVVSDIDWNCEVRRNYAKNNMGCGVRPATGISWVFEHVEESIILEDDCVPEEFFFPFCRELLLKYKNDNNVMLISGMNLLEEYESDYSYIFSKACTIGAWATWRDTWEKYDFEIQCFDNREVRKQLKKRFNDKKMWLAKYSAWDITRRKIIAKEKVNWWDYQLHMLLFLYDAVGIIPCKNLVKNIGFGESATHVTDMEAKHFKLKTYDLNNLVHPEKITYCEKFDKTLFREQFKDVSYIRVFLSLIKRRFQYKD